MNSIKQLNIVGCGKLGRTLGALWFRAGLLRIGEICNRSFQSSAAAGDFIGAGKACGSIEKMAPAPLWMIATPDSEIRLVAENLAESGRVGRGDLVFHCSGALSSELLSSLADQGALIASMHPIRSFANPVSAMESFPGTVCSLEGHDEASDILESLAAGLGARCFRLSARSKMLCHAGHVFASNYIVAVIDVAQRLYREAGVSDEAIQALLPPLVAGVGEAVISRGTTEALTGPVSRGESQIVAAQLSALDSVGQPYAKLYRALAQQALIIAERKGDLGADKLRALGEILGPIPE